MAGTGYDWSAWTYVQLSAGDWDGDTSADNAIQTSDAIALDGKAACVIGIVLDEPDGDAVAANSVTIAVLGDANDAYENPLVVAGAGLGSPWQFVMTPIISDNVYKQFSIDPKYYDNCKICIMNESGANLDITVSIKTATIPLAS